MESDKLKQMARLNILEKLKQKKMPSKGTTEIIEPATGPIPPEQMALPSETMNDWGPSESLQQRLNPGSPKTLLRKKKRPDLREGEDATLPTNATGSY